jgi:hypothetical protein
VFVQRASPAVELRILQNCWKCNSVEIAKRFLVDAFCPLGAHVKQHHLGLDQDAQINYGIVPISLQTLREMVSGPPTTACK